MKLIWTTGNSILSKFIRWLFNEQCSHFAIIFDDKIVFHSNLTGVHLNWSSNFLNHNKIIHILEKNDLSIEQEENIYQNCLPLEGNPWDFKAGIYLMYRGLLYKFLNIPFPSKNYLGDKKWFFCTELGNVLESLYPGIINENLDLRTPEMLYKLLKEKYGENIS